MIIDALLENYYVRNIFYQIDVVKGHTVTLIADVMPEDAEVYAKGDKILDIDDSKNIIKIKALEVGLSKIRIEKSALVEGKIDLYRELLINVVESVGAPATSLNTKFSEAVPRT